MGSCGDSRPNLSLYSFKLCMSLVVFFCQIVSTAFPRSRMQQGVTVRGTSLWMSKNKPIFLSRCPMKSSHCFLTLFRTTRRLNKKTNKKTISNLNYSLMIVSFWPKYSCRFSSIPFYGEKKTLKSHSNHLLNQCKVFPGVF